MGPDRIRRVLVVDDDARVRHAVEVALGRTGFQIRTTGHIAEAMELLSTGDFGLVIVDLRLSDHNGLALLRSLKECSPHSYIILVSSARTQDLALSAVQEGAYGYLAKPIKSEELLLMVAKIEERERLREENLRLREEVKRTFGLEGIIAHSDEMQRVLSLVQKFAPYKTPILITGESGTGKELLARAVHHASDRAEHPLIAVNCAAIPDALLESELFGHVRGAFTGAVRNRKGLVEEAHRGTLFLDEIGELSVGLQAKLLRVLENEELRPIGDSRVTSVDVRLLCATSRDLVRAVREGTFREDLLYRINVLTLHIPPLRARPDDIPPLAERFLNTARQKLHPHLEGITPEAMKVLLEHPWPGNVRELEHVIERAAILTSDGWIREGQLPPELLRRDRAELTGLDLSIKRATRLLEERLIEKALRRTGGNRTHAARLLEISHRALLYKIKEYGLQDAGEGGD